MPSGRFNCNLKSCRSNKGCESHEAARLIRVSPRDVMAGERDRLGAKGVRPNRSTDARGETCRSILAAQAGRWWRSFASQTWIKTP